VVGVSVGDDDGHSQTIGVVGGEYTLGVCSITGGWSNLGLKCRVNSPRPPRGAKILPS
jgi:hypothetical protein